MCDNLVGLLVEGSGTERAGIASVRIAFDAYGHLYLNEGHELTDRLQPAPPRPHRFRVFDLTWMACGWNP